MPPVGRVVRDERPARAGQVLVARRIVRNHFHPMLTVAHGRRIDGDAAIGRVAVGLAGLAISGGLFIVPAFAAVQAWSGADYRARTVGAVNVLNAAFMTGGTVLVALLQHVGVSVPQLFVLIGALTLVAAVAIRRTMPSDVEPEASLSLP